MRRLKILAIEPDIGVRDLYQRYLSKKYNVEAMANVSYELDASKYDVVIVHSEEAKVHITNIPMSHLIVAASYPSAHPDGNWAITKPFHMEELNEIVEVIGYPEIPGNQPTRDKVLQ